MAATKRPAARTAPDWKVLAARVLDVLDGGGAHVRFREAVAGIPPTLRGFRPPGCPHSAWELLEHLRIAQGDILRYCVDPKHRSPKWPRGYWPRTQAPPDSRAWARSVRAYESDLAGLRRLVRSRARDLLEPIPHAPDASLLEEAFLVANHGSYHVGQLVLLRRILGAWRQDPRKIVE
jgi:hypothetical protein